MVITDSNLPIQTLVVKKSFLKVTINWDSLVWISFWNSANQSLRIKTRNACTHQYLPETQMKLQKREEGVGLNIGLNSRNFV